MRKAMITMIGVICMLSLAACGKQAPSLEEVKQAIGEGNVTIEDALEKGWITQEWADDYQEERSVPAASKTDATAVTAFTTTTISGEEFTQDNISAVTFFAFVDPTDEEAKAYYQGLVSTYEKVKENGGDILLCTKSEEAIEMFTDAPFPVIIYNDSLKEATKNNAEMIEGRASIGSWYIDNAFLSAWYGKIDTEQMAESAKAFADMRQEISGEKTDGEETSGSMSVME